MARHHGHVFESINVGKKSPTSVYQTDELVTYVDSIKGNEPLTLDEEVELGRKIQASPKDSEGKPTDRNSINKLVSANLLFVVSVAKRYLYYGGTLSALDLVSEGNIGLVEAAETYNPTYRFKFICYAVHYIRMRITQAISKKSRIVTDYHRQVANKHSSLDTPIGEDGDTTLGDMICTSMDAESFRNESLFNDLMRVLNNLLKPKEVTVICFTFGINTPQNNYSKTNMRRIMAENLDMTPERVRQIEKQALFKVRRNKKALELLSKYLNG